MEQSNLDLLQTVPPYHLQALAKLRHMPISSKEQTSNTIDVTSASAIAEVAQYLFNPTVIIALLHDLGDMERVILRELVACGGRANSRDLALYLMTNGLLNQVKGETFTFAGEIGAPRGRLQDATLQYPTPHPHGVFEQALHRLLLLGLLFWGKQTHFAGRDYASGVYDGVLIVPQAVMEVAQGEWHVEEAEDEPASDDQELGEGIRSLQRMLYLYWSFVASLREGLPLVSSGLLSRPALRQIMEHLNPRAQVEQMRAENEIPRLLFIRLLLMKLALLQNRQGALYALPAEEFFSLPLLERARRCYSSWLDSPFWNEMNYLPEVIVRPGPALLEAAHEEVLQARRMIVERVVHERPRKLLDVAAFVARTKLHVPYLLFPRRYGSRAERYSVGSNPYGWDFRLRRGWLTHREGWYLVEGGFIKAVVLGPLYWLGLVEVHTEGNVSTFRLAPGAQLVMQPQPPEITEPPWGRLIVQPNFELIALAPVSEALLIQLDRFAERVGLEHIAQYRLTKVSVTRAIQKGLHVDTIQELLKRASEGEIPQNVRYSLVEWERQARRVEIWRGLTLLEVDDPALLDAMFAEAEIQVLLGRRLTPTLAEVASQHLSTIQEALWQLGYLPALASTPLHAGVLETGQLVACEPQWRLHLDGLLEPCYAVTDLFLTSELERMSERDETTGWQRITPQSIQRACARGVALEHMLLFLQHYCEGGIPAPCLIRLKLWGGGYGEQSSIRVEAAPMLSLSAQELQDLQADEELTSLLGSEVEQERRLVRVETTNLERVVQLLKERGFEVE